MGNVEQWKQKSFLSMNLAKHRRVDTKNSNPRFTGKYQGFHYTFLLDAYVYSNISTLIYDFIN